MSIWENSILYETDEYIYIKPSLTVKSNQILQIDRIQDKCCLISDLLIPADSISKTIHGLVGSIKLISGNYLIVISSKSQIGTLTGHDIWRVDKYEMIPYARTVNHLNENEKKLNNQYKNMVENFLNIQHFYFSYTYDITHSLQHLQETHPDFLNMSLYERADKRFLWNSWLLKNLNPTNDISYCLIPIMLGFVSIQSVEINQRMFEFGLISRRSCYNAGTRFNVRGSDNDGNVANFIETEQIIHFMDYKCSFIQIRGSIPIFWSQKPNLKYKPSISIDSSKNHLEVVKKHFTKNAVFYNHQVCVNLVNQHGAEGLLEKSFSDLISQINDPSIKYESFDFHKQCGKDKWDRLSILINRLANDQDSFGYFCLNKNGTILTNQNGVFRINCIDCLDRTNVVQGLLAKRILHIQLIKLGILSETESIEMNEPFYNLFRNIWADNGDFLSIQYAGTGALKSDFTRTGKRTTYGLMRDGYNSIMRYFINNFYDGFRQDSIDLVLGNYKISSNEGILVDSSPIALTTEKKYLALPVIGLGTFSMFIISLLIPAETFQEQITYVLFWGIATICTLSIMIYFGKEIVNTPKLFHKKNKKE